MLYSELKPMREIMAFLGGEQNIFLLGCSGCAEASGTGGLPQVLSMKSKLEAEGKRVVGHTTIDFLCQKALVKSRLRAKEEVLAEADSLLVMACGIGVQAVASVVPKVCHPACNTVYLGEVRGEWMGGERCRECGECLLEFTGGICPLTSCTKSLLNGPCGGARNGKCEVDPGRDCAWEVIYFRLKTLGQLNKLRQFILPKDYSKMIVPSKIQETPLWSVECKTRF